MAYRYCNSKISTPAFIRSTAVVFVLLLLVQLNTRAEEDRYRPRYRRLLTQANALYEQYEFQEAIKKYQQVLQLERNCGEAWVYLARCYHYLRDPMQVIESYQKVDGDRSALAPRDKLFYAQALESTGEYQRAIPWYQQYQEGNPQPHIAQKIEYLRDRETDVSAQDSYFIQKLPINSSASDFAPAFYQDGIVFVSARPVKKQDKLYGWHQQSFLNLYYAPAKSDSEWETPISFSADINTDLHEGPSVFYNNGQSVVFTRNPRPNRQKGKVLRLQLFFAELDESSPFDWKNIEPFEYNHWSYSVGHPAITSDGQHLYFVSDMPGGYGGTDLYVCHRRNGAWSNPQNLGKKVNTPEDEMFPFVQDSLLYFASDGHAGLGGLDIFRVTRAGTTDPVNLGAPINSTADDFGYISDATASSGYFSSNREPEQSGDDNIYYFSSQTSTSQIVSFAVLDSLEHQPISEAKVVLQDASGDTLRVARTNEDGICQLALQKQQQYRLTVNQLEYSTLRRPIKINAPTTQPLPLLLEKSLMAKGIIRDTDSGQPLDGVNLTLEDQQGKQQQQQTDTTGSYAFPLEPEQTYQLKVEKEDYFNQTVTFDTQEKTEGVLDVAPKVEKIVVGKAIRIDKLYELENIYYSLDKWEIQPEAAQELDQLVQLLRDNPTVHIELSAHTDARGSSSYNLRLSELRAMAAFSYITTRDIDPQRIVAKGYGEQKLINHCRDGISCTEQEHYQNRRTEFAVTKY
ncbi:MAG: carboxypeptidase regulatory-like domain-containing protein [Bacteroidota bacterium]